MHIPSLFAEDSDFVYFTVFNREQCDYIGLMEYALHYCKIHSYLTFYEEPAKNIARDLKQYGLKILGARPDRSAYIQIWNHANITDPSFLECMGERLLQLLDDIDMHINTYRTAHCIGNLGLYKETLRSILESLDIDQALYVRWKREYEMYSLVKMYYPDVVFQYHRMRKQVIRNGGTREDFNNRIKCLYSEAADYGIDKQKIRRILTTLGI